MMPLTLPARVPLLARLLRVALLLTQLQPQLLRMALQMPMLRTLHLRRLLLVLIHVQVKVLRLLQSQLLSQLLSLTGEIRSLTLTTTLSVKGRTKLSRITQAINPSLYLPLALSLQL